MSELPLPGGRNINNLILTTPNACSTTGQGTYAVNGHRPRNNNYMVDGSDNNDISVTIATSQIVPEAVAEFQVLTEPVQRRVRPQQRRADQRDHQVGDQPFPRRLVGLLPGERALLAEQHREGQRPDRAREVQPPSAGRRPRRPGPPRQAVLLRPLSARLAADRGAAEARRSASRRRPALRRCRTCRSAPASPQRAGRPSSAARVPAGRLRARIPCFRNVTTTAVNGVPIETGQTNVNIVDPSIYHTCLGRADHRLGDNDNLTVRYSLNDRNDENASATCGSARCSPATRR